MSCRWYLDYLVPPTSLPTRELSQNVGASPGLDWLLKRLIDC